MPEATLKLVAKLAGVGPATVSRVVNGSENVAAATREKILAIIRDLNYTPNTHAGHRLKPVTVKLLIFMERETGIEPATFSLGS